MSTPMTKAEKEKIDNASYLQLLSWWRFSTPGSKLFDGETGTYYAKKMSERRAEVGDAAHTAISKIIGWEK
jgi:hypothetical protein